MMKKNKLLSSQIGFYFGSKMSSDKSSFNIAEYVEIDTQLNLSIFISSIRFVLNKTDTLRAFFKDTNGTPFQYFIKSDFNIDSIDLSQEVDVMHSALKLIKSDSMRPFSLDKPPLFRQMLIKKSERDFIWYFCSHHILIDGYGVTLFINEVADVYKKRLNGEKINYQVSTLYELIKEEVEYKASDLYREDKAFWQVILSSLPDPQSLSSSDISTGSAIRCTSDFPRGAYQNIDNPSWVAMTFTAVLIYLYLCTGKKHQVIGMPVMARTQLHSRNAITCKTNILPLDIYIEEEDNVHKLVVDVEKKIKKVLKHQSFRYEEMKSLRGVKNRNQLFNVIVNIIPFGSTVSFYKNKYSMIHNVCSGGAQDIVFNFRLAPEGSVLRMEADADSGLYDNHSLDQHCFAIKSHFQSLDVSLKGLSMTY
jgi:nonribosomal peptide synthetase MxcG